MGRKLDGNFAEESLDADGRQFDERFAEGNLDENWTKTGRKSDHASHPSAARSCAAHATIIMVGQLSGVV